MNGGFDGEEESDPFMINVASSRIGYDSGISRDSSTSTAALGVSVTPTPSVSVMVHATDK